MVISVQARPGYRPAAIREGDDRFVALAAELGAGFAPRAAGYDRDNRFVEENFRDLQASGYTRLAVPVELGGFGASVRQVVYAQAELARHCASTALAINMHLFVTLVTVYRRNHGAPVDGLLRRVANEDLILMSSGGSDGLWPTATAVRVEGGYRVTGRKIFCSQAPVGGAISTVAVYDDPETGPVGLAMMIPATSPGYEVVETWDTLGMRGTGSHDIQLTDVFVADAQVAGRRQIGQIDPSLRNALLHFAPLVASVYYGIAAAARDEAIAAIARKRGAGADDAIVQRQVGLMETRLRTSWWALLGALDEIGDAPALDDRTIGTLQIAKRQVIADAIEIVGIASELVGGFSYFKRSPLEQAQRDVRAGLFHPFTPEKTLIHAGRMALGVDVAEIW